MQDEDPFAGIHSKDDLLRRFFPELYRKKEIEHERAKAQVWSEVIPQNPEAARVSKAKPARKTLTPAQQRLLALQKVLAGVPKNAPNEEYCEYLDRADLFTSKKMQADGCPKRFPDAWKNSKWHARIRREKSSARHFKLA